MPSNQVRPLAVALGCEALAGVAVSFRRTHETEEGLRSRKGDPDFNLPTIATTARLGQIGAPQIASEASPLPPVFRGRKRGRDGPKGRQLWGELKEPKKAPFLRVPVGATRRWQGRG